ncbi:MAG: exonuclease SbcCD subunit D [Clostridia bacterium]|nr:exonuclease SbcCD subunit D [Clostridia bacterium]
MRILHTSDWHLGRTLEGRDRLDEQEAFITEICDIANQEKVDLVLIAGDVFDSSNPPARAEQLFYRGIYELSRGGRRGVIAIAGNHDNPERLRASDPLAEQLGITLLGLPKDQAAISKVGSGKVQRLAAGPGWLEVAIPGCEHNAVVIALPYPSEQRLKEILTEKLGEEELQKSYSERVGEIFRALRANYRRDTVNLCMSHLFIKGGKESESERPIQLGGSPVVDAEMLPWENCQYIALGHLHRPQRVGGQEFARYSGSPLSYSFSEAGQAKAVYLVDCLPGQKAQVEEISLTKGRPLVRWEAKEGLSQVIKWCEENRDKEAWIDLIIYTDEPLTNSEIKTLRDLRHNFINIRPVMKKELSDRFNPINRISLPIEKLFQEFYRKNYQAEPSAELTRLFMELLEVEEGGED